MMFRIIQAVLSLLTIILAGIYYLLGQVLLYSSHDIPLEERRSAISNGNLAIILAPVFLILIWLPWKRIFGIKKTEK